MPKELDKDKILQATLPVFNKPMRHIAIMLAGLILMQLAFYCSNPSVRPAKKILEGEAKNIEPTKDSTAYWAAPDINAITDPKQKALVEYGKELIVHTAKYLGPKGSVLHLSNGMNCQNCHLQGGTAVFGNNYGSVASLYPRFRARSGTIENIYKRVNDCFERSLNGKALDTPAKEMQSIASYINFIGSNVTKGEKAAGSGFKDLAYLDRAANPEKGKPVYTAKCQSCHQANGEGLFNADKTEYTFPPLWGKNSFNDGAGLYRISNMTKYVKYNMPNGATYKNPQLTDEETWDVAAFIISQPRPHINLPKDWPDISKKPVDHPFGPYIDIFTEKQHKFGPFKPIEEQKKRELLTNDKTRSK